MLLQVDILLNNAGLALGTAPVHENSIEVSSLTAQLYEDKWH